jgi:hypothetical protein
VLPTFGPSLRIRPAVARVFEENRRARFRNTGVLGLVMLDQATKQYHAANRSALAKTLRTMGLKIAAPTKAGSGLMMSYLKYEEVNGRISSALEKLARRASDTSYI